MRKFSVTLLLWLGVQCVILCEPVVATEDDNVDHLNSSVYRQRDIRIVESTGGVQLLPSIYTKNLYRWVLLNDNDLVAIPTNGEYVNPTSITHLWWPIDIPTMEVRTTLDFIVWNGQPNYVCGGLDIRVLDNEKQEWRNHGLHSAPLALQWLPMSSASLPGFRVQGFVRPPAGDTSWIDLPTDVDLDAAITATNRALEVFGLYWASTTHDFDHGFHVISVPLGGTTWTPLPLPHSQSYLLAALASAQPNALIELLSNPPTTTASILGVEVVSTAPGGESEHLPKVYQTLYT